MILGFHNMYDVIYNKNFKKSPFKRSSKINNPYFTSHYKKNSVYSWIPSDDENLFEEHCKRYPDSLAMQYYKKNPIEYRINNYGFRTDDDFNEIDEGNVFLGCSHTLGVGLHLKDVWSYKLNEYLGGKFWNLSIGGTGIETCFRLLYGFKDLLKIKNIFLYLPYENRHRYEVFDEGQCHLYNPWRYDNGFYTHQYALGTLMNEDYAHLNFYKNAFAIETLAKQIGCNFYMMLKHPIWSDEIEKNQYQSKFNGNGVLINLNKKRMIKSNNILEARDFRHMNVAKHQLIYEQFLNLINS